MLKGFGVMKSRHVAIASFIFTPVGLVFAADSLRCLFMHCIVDDASRRALAYLGIPILIAHAVFSSLVLFPAIVALKRWVGPVFSSIGVAAIAAAAIAAIFHDPAIDGPYLHTWIHLGAPLTVAWSIAGLVACAFWPNYSFNPDAYNGKANQ